MVYQLGGYSSNSHNLILKWYPRNETEGFINPGLTLYIFWPILDGCRIWRSGPMNSGLTKQLNNMVSTWFQNGFLNKVQPAKAVFPLSRTVEGSISKDGLVAHFPRPAVRNLPTCPDQVWRSNWFWKAWEKRGKSHGPWSIIQFSLLKWPLKILKDFGQARLTPLVNHRFPQCHKHPSTGWYSKSSINSDPTQSNLLDEIHGRPVD